MDRRGESGGACVGEIEKGFRFLAEPSLFALKSLMMTTELTEVKMMANFVDTLYHRTQKLYRKGNSIEKGRNAIGMTPGLRMQERSIGERL